jgi:hypothetical protein
MWKRHTKSQAFVETYKTKAFSGSPPLMNAKTYKPQIPALEDEDVNDDDIPLANWGNFHF